MSDSDVKIVKKKQKIKNDQNGHGQMLDAQHLLYETQSTDSNQRVQDNKAAERSRLYRERHREEINQRRRHSRQRQKILQRKHTEHARTDESNQVPTPTGSQLGCNPHTERQRRYYERHREEINKRKRDNRLKLSTSPSVPITAAERNRNYRKRNKQEINERRRISRLRQQQMQMIHAAVHTESGEDNVDAAAPHYDHHSNEAPQGIAFSTESSLSAPGPSSLNAPGWETENHVKQEDLPASGSEHERPAAAPVPDVPVCRVCLATDCKMYAMTDYRMLSQAYETVTGLLIQNEDNLPRYLCSECSIRLLKCANFRATSLRSQSTLLGILKEHGIVTLELIQSVKEIQHPPSLYLNNCDNQANYDIEIELNKKQNLCLDVLREDKYMTRSAVSGLKVEDGVTDRGDTNNPPWLLGNGVCAIKVETDDIDKQVILNAESDDITHLIGLSNNVVDSIKSESHRIMYLKNINDTNAAKDDAMHIKNLPKNIAVVNIKNENHDMYNYDDGNYEVMSNENMVWLNENVAGNRLKVESGNLMKLDNVHSTNTDAGREDAFIGGHYSNASLPVGEARHKDKLSAAGLSDIINGFNESEDVHAAVTQT